VLLAEIMRRRVWVCFLHTSRCRFSRER